MNVWLFFENTAPVTWQSIKCGLEMTWYIVPVKILQLYSHKHVVCL